jgi:hypothetical protein
MKRIYFKHISCASLMIYLIIYGATIVKFIVPSSETNNAYQILESH